MQVDLIIEQGADFKDIELARKLKKQILSNDFIDKEKFYFSEIEPAFPDSNLYFDGTVTICIPTAVNLAAPHGIKCAAESLKSRYKN